MMVGYYFVLLCLLCVIDHTNTTVMPLPISSAYRVALLFPPFALHYNQGSLVGLAVHKCHLFALILSAPTSILLKLLAHRIKWLEMNFVTIVQSMKQFPVVLKSLDLPFC